MIGNRSLMVVASGSMSEKHADNGYLVTNNLTTCEPMSPAPPVISILLFILRFCVFILFDKYKQYKIMGHTLCVFFETIEFGNAK